MRLLDLQREKTDSNMYTFVNMDDDLCDLEELEIEEVCKTLKTGSVNSINNEHREIVTCLY